MIEGQPNKSLRTLLIVQVITLIILVLVLAWTLLPLLVGGGNYKLPPNGSGSQSSDRPSQAPISWLAPTTTFTLATNFSLVEMIFSNSLFK